MKRFRRHEAGDTIVEVLIAIVIVATILGGAYATANRSLLATRESQERGEALNLAQGQVEMLRSLALTSTLATPSSIFTNKYVFCVANNAPTNAIQTSSGPVDIGSLPSVNKESPDGITYLSGCQQNWQSSGYEYDVAIDRCTASDSSSSDCSSYGAELTNAAFVNAAIFTVHIRWDSTNGGRDEVTLQYRLYEGST